jgi:type IV pilus assembly protein PilC
MRKLFSGSEISRKEATNFLKKLSLLTEAGLSITSALDNASNKPYLKTISEKVRSGASFSGELDPKIFTPVAVSMILVGENNGNLSGGITKACQYLEKRDSFNKKLIGSLIYPAFVLMLCGAAIFILVSILLPSFAGIFNGLGIQLPPLSRFILDLARYMPLITVITSIFIYYALKYLLSDKGLSFPVVGRFRSKLLAASFFQAMSGSISSGMNIVESLQLSSGVINSRSYKEKLNLAISSIIEGNTLSNSLNSIGLFDETVISLISAGEQSSSLDKVFAQLSRIYEEEIENSTKTFSSLVEPISTLATGLVVGIIVFAMFMPIIKLISVLGS